MSATSFRLMVLTREASRATGRNLVLVGNSGTRKWCLDEDRGYDAGGRVPVTEWMSTAEIIASLASLSANAKLGGFET